jgi:hypothetical protein
MRDSVKCYMHGGASPRGPGAGRPRGIPMHPNTLRAIREGRRRWQERMRLAKARGLIEKLPIGKASADKRVRKALQRIIEVKLAMTEKTALPARHWAQLSPAEWS